MQHAILEAREQRWQMKQELARRFGACVCSLCLNIPGPDKNPPGAEQACALLHAALRRAYALEVRRWLAVRTRVGRGKAQLAPIPRAVRGPGTAIAYATGGKSADGPYRLMISPLPARTLKRMAVRLENTHPLGRLADIDILAATGTPVLRADLGLPPRVCFLCGEPAALCRRKQHHPQETLMAFVGAMLQSVPPQWGTDA